MHIVQPSRVVNIGVNRLRALTAGVASHLGPAVNRKPVKKSGMNPKVINKACALAGASVHTTATPKWRANNTAHHQAALLASMAAPAKKARRCGAASSQIGRQVVSIGGWIGATFRRPWLTFWFNGFSAMGACLRLMDG